MQRGRGTGEFPEGAAGLWVSSLAMLTMRLMTVIVETRKSPKARRRHNGLKCRRNQRTMPLVALHETDPPLHSGTSALSARSAANSYHHTDPAVGCRK